jgi:hypothetical protein
MTTDSPSLNLRRLVRGERDSTTGRQLRLCMLPGISSSSADPLKADRQAGPCRHPHGVLTVPGLYPVRGVNSAVKGHRDGSQLCSGTGGKHDRRKLTRGDRQHSMAAANRALPESTAVIELVSGCAEAQQPQARRGATASHDQSQLAVGGEIVGCDTDAG